MGHTLDLRRAFPILQCLSEEELAAAPTARIEKGAGSSFFHEGDPGDAVYGVVTGRVQIVKQSASGRELTLDVFGPGELFAAVAVLRGTPMPASAVALEPSLCLRIDGAWFKRSMERHPQIMARILQVMMNRLVVAGDASLRLATSPVEMRLAVALLRMAEKFGVERNGEIWIGRAFTRQNLANLAGTTVETAIRVMSRWTRASWISSSNGRIHICNPEAIRELAEG